MKRYIACLILTLAGSYLPADTIHWEDGSSWENVAVTRIAQDTEKTSKPYYLVIEVTDYSIPKGIVGGAIDKKFVAIIFEEKQQALDSLSLKLALLEERHTALKDEFEQTKKQWEQELEILGRGKGRQGRMNERMGMGNQRGSQNRRQQPGGMGGDGGRRPGSMGGDGARRSFRNQSTQSQQPQLQPPSQTAPQTGQAPTSLEDIKIEVNEIVRDPKTLEIGKTYKTLKGISLMRNIPEGKTKSGDASDKPFIKIEGKVIFTLKSIEMRDNAPWYYIKTTNTTPAYTAWLDSTSLLSQTIYAIQSETKE